MQTQVSINPFLYPSNYIKLFKKMQQKKTKKNTHRMIETELKKSTVIRNLKKNLPFKKFFKTATLRGMLIYKNIFFKNLKHKFFT